MTSIPLPQLSNRVVKHLRDGNVHIVWRELINEYAHYYMSKNSTISKKAEYRAIREKIVQQFPAIALMVLKNGSVYYSFTVST
jgi:hypothetical protein